jgi:putative chitinase
MELLTQNQLIKAGAKAKFVPLYLPYLNEFMAWGGVKNKLRLAHFLAQINHESMGLQYVEEIASGQAYEGRIDLGNVHPGDGVKYKGRGLIQTTGRTNYGALKFALGVDFLTNPELLEEPEWAVKSAYYFWGSRALNRLADEDDILSISQIINQGSKAKPGSKRKLPNGYADRLRLLGKAKAALGL